MNHDPLLRNPLLLLFLPFRQAFAAVCADPEQVDPTPFRAKAVDEIGKRWRTLGSGGSPDGKAAAPAAPGAHPPAAPGTPASKNGLKTILNILKSICRDAHDFEQGLSLVLDKDPSLLPQSPLGSAWQLRAQSIKAVIRSEQEGASCCCCAPQPSDATPAGDESPACC